MADDLRERIKTERTLRGLSVRAAAHAGRTTNTTWGRYESGETPLTDGIRTAVATAFDWPTDWPEHPPVLPETAARTLLAEVERLALAVQVLAEEARDRLGAENDFVARLAALEAAQARRQSP